MSTRHYSLSLILFAACGGPCPLVARPSAPRASVSSDGGFASAWDGGLQGPPPGTGSTASPASTHPGGSGDGGAPTPEQEADAVRSAMLIPSAAVARSEALTELALLTIIQASLLGGGHPHHLTLSGTVQEQGTAFTYSPRPADRLVYAPATGTSTDFFVQNAHFRCLCPDQDMTASDFALEFRGSADGGLDVDTHVERSGHDLSRTVSGTVPFEGGTVTAALSERTTLETDPQGRSAALDPVTTRNGVVTRGMLQATVNESQHLQRGGAVKVPQATLTRTFDSTLTLGHDSFTLLGGRIESRSVQGQTVELTASGTVNRVSGELGALRVELATVDGGTPMASVIVDVGGSEALVQAQALSPAPPAIPASAP